MKIKVTALIVAFVVLIAAIVIGLVLGGSDGSKSASGGAPEQTVQPGDDLTAVVETNKGTFDIKLDSTRAPITVNSFVHLADDGFYDGLGFHRISKGFVIQGGDPDGTGEGGPGYSVVEKPPGDLKYTPGVVAMAKTGAEAPGTSGSQFFVVTGPKGASLPPDYALLGQVSQGMEVVDAIGKLGDASEQPTETITIEKITIDGE